jgi:hypothetical protein
VTRNRQVRQAQRTRSQIARTFVALSDGNVHADEILRDVPRCLQRMRTYDVVRRFPRLSGDGASTVLRKAKVWPVTRLGNLTLEERERIIEHLPPRAKVS